MNSRLEKNRKTKFNLALALTAGILIIIGLVMLFSASAVVGLEFGDSGFYIKRQLISLAVGLILILIVQKTDYHFWQKISFPFFLFSILLLLLVLFSPLGISAGGARRWLNLGIGSFQPGELAKLAIIIYLAAWFAKSTLAGAARFVAILGLLFVLIIMQPDLGTFIIIAATAYALYFTGGANLKHLLIISLVALVILSAAVLTSPYRLSRVSAFLNPASDPLGASYHTNQAIIAVGSGGLFGAGLGHSRQKFFYLPEVVGDSLFAVMAEELGFIFSAGIIILFLVFLREGVRIAKNAPDKFGQLAAFGIVFWICSQAFVNIGAMLGLLPLTGIPLPFMSFGGTAMVVNLAGVGILLNIHRNS